MPVVILVKVWTEDIAAHHLIEERIDRAPPRQLKRVAQGAILDADYRLGAPLVAVKDKAGEHLLGRIVPVTGATAELLGEVDGERLQRAHTVIVQNIEPSETVGSLARQSIGRPRGLRHGAYRHDGEHPAPHHVALEKTAEGPFRVDKQPHEREEQQRIAGVSDGNAPRVGVQREYAAAHVGVVG